MSKPKTIIFFPNGMAAVCDENGEQMPKYQGRHMQAIESLKQDGIDFTTLAEVMGRPQQGVMP